MTSFLDVDLVVPEVVFWDRFAKYNEAHDEAGRFTFGPLEKYNPFHDEQGRFAEGPGDGGLSISAGNDLVAEPVGGGGGGEATTGYAITPTVDESTGQKEFQVTYNGETIAGFGTQDDAKAYLHDLTHEFHGGDPEPVGGTSLPSGYTMQHGDPLDAMTSGHAVSEHGFTEKDLPPGYTLAQQPNGHWWVTGPDTSPVGATTPDVALDSFFMVHPGSALPVGYAIAYNNDHTFSVVDPNGNALSQGTNKVEAVADWKQGKAPEGEVVNAFTPKPTAQPTPAPAIAALQESDLPAGVHLVSVTPEKYNPDIGYKVYDEKGNSYGGSTPEKALHSYFNSNPGKLLPEGYTVGNNEITGKGEIKGPNGLVEYASTGHASQLGTVQAFLAAGGGQKTPPNLGDLPETRFGTGAGGGPEPLATAGGVGFSVISSDRDANHDYANQAYDPKVPIGTPSTHNFTSAEKSTIFHFTSSGNEDINHSLRYAEKPHSDTTPNNIAKLDRMFADSRTDKPMTLYRGISLNEVARLQAAVKAGRGHYVDKGYPETSTSESFAQSWKSGDYIVMSLPKGSPAFYADPMSSHKGEHEWIVARNQAFKVDKVEPSSGGYGNHFKFTVHLVDQKKPSETFVDPKQLKLPYTEITDLNKARKKARKPPQPYYNQADKFSYDTGDLQYLDDEELNAFIRRQQMKTQKFNENHDEQGRFATGDSGGMVGTGDSPGSGYSAEAKIIDGKLHTSNVDDAVRALAENRDVVLNQPHEVSTLLNKLAAIGRDAAAKGEKAPKYDLCRVSIEGTNLFCAESLGIPRIDMPQLSGKPIPGSKADALPKDAKGRADLGDLFKQHLAGIGKSIVEDTVDASHLRATQNELDGVRTARQLSYLRAGSEPPPTFISKDDYIVDGHHRWAAAVVHKYDEAGSVRAMPLKVERVDMDIVSLLKEAKRFTKEWGMPEVAKFNPHHDDHGRFSEGDGDGGGSGDQTSASPAEYDGEETAALGHYTVAGYRDLNHSLRHSDYRPDDPGETAKLRASLDSAFAKTPPSETAMTLHRGISHTASERLAQAGEGATFVDKGFVSTSRNENEAELFGVPAGAQVHIYVPKGTRMIDMYPYSNQPDEREMLLPRGSTFKLRGWEDRSDGDRHYNVELVKPVGKYNENHDAQGRFAEGSGGGDGGGGKEVPIGQLGFTHASPQAFIAAREHSHHPGYLSPLEPGDLAHSDIYLGGHGKVGVVVTDGDIGNVFNNGGPKGAGAEAVATAIDHGGRTLDAFDGFLPRFYGQLGFKETGRMKFDPAQAPPKWNFKEDNNPDVVFMAWQGYPGGRDASVERAANRQSEDRLPVMPSGVYYNDFGQAKTDAAHMAKRHMVILMDKLQPQHPPDTVDGIDWSRYTDNEREVLVDVAKDRGYAWVDAHATMILNQARLIGELPEKN